MFVDRARTEQGNLGFTLIEVVIAMILLSIGIFGTYALAGYVLRANSFGKQVTMASSLALDKIEEFKNASPADLVDGSDTDTDIAPGQTFTRTWDVEDDSGLKSVEVTVTWQHRPGTGGEASVTHAAILSK